jgi:hypothetical protein
MRWSEAGYLSRIVLAHAPHQASVSLILGVRQKKNMSLSLEERIRRYKPSACPKCGGTDLRFILGGRPTAEGYAMIEQKLAVLGTCFITPDKPDWRCVSCRNEWFDPEDPERIEMMALLDRIRQKRDLSRNEK